MTAGHISADYRVLARHYEACLAQHGDTHLGVDWPNAVDAKTRYRIMLEIAKDRPHPKILDVGCGAAHLLDYALAEGRAIEYVGVDISPAFVALSRQKHPRHTFFQADLLQDSLPIDPSDFVIMNGLFTEKQSLSDEDMYDFLTAMLRRAFTFAKVGIAFNVMSKLVDWEREDLFHVPFDRLLAFVRRQLSRHVVVRHDYGLYEYTTYVYREAQL